LVAPDSLDGIVQTIGVFAAIFDESGRILCVRMNYGTRGWSTPGGRLESGESPLAALRREVLEETGLEIEPGALIGVYAKRSQNDVVLCFHAKVLRQNGWQPNGEISELGYFSAAEIPSPMTKTARTRIQDALEGRLGVFRVMTESGS
jgi:8-oxo-dGTP pyrophosphatase MutT (NUDIX family)